MRVFAVSDLHSDYTENKGWVTELSGNDEYKDDALIVAGDVSDDIDVLSRTLELLVCAFRCVVFVPGNHDLWVRRQERGRYDSLEKWAVLQEACDSLGVHTRPVCMEGIWLVPLLSWYHTSWDREPDVPGSLPINRIMVDFQACQWGSLPGASNGDEALARHIDSLNDPGFEQLLAELAAQAEAAGGVRPPVFAASHFLPFQELMPEKRMLYFPNLPKACGSDFLAERLRRLRPTAHVFGHTHFSWDATLDGTRYVQWPLGYPHEQRRRRDGGKGWLPLLLFDTATQEMSEPRRCHWSTHYASFKRDPNNIIPAPWANTK